jgi:zinc/manganese transport system substrate-binding protein
MRLSPTYGSLMRVSSPFLPAVIVSCVLICGCASGGTDARLGGRVEVVAAESFWGSVASQLGGARASVQSIIANPAQDPHDYEPTPADARALAAAQLAIVNGVGYDPWVPRLLAADPESGRIVLDVGHLLGLAQGANPHRWYDPADVEAVANALTIDLKTLDPKHAGYYDRQLAAFESRALASYHATIVAIRERYNGVPVGASESIFALLAPALGLRLLTPASFMDATSEGTDVSAQDTITAQRQITDHEIKVWIYNSQNTTPEIQRLNALAHQNAIPVVTVTETLTPAGATFEQWQTAQLAAIARALHQATGR